MPTDPPDVRSSGCRRNTSIFADAMFARPQPIVSQGCPDDAIMPVLRNANRVASRASVILQTGRDKTTRRANHF